MIAALEFLPMYLIFFDDKFRVWTFGFDSFIDDAQLDFSLVHLCFEPIDFKSDFEAEPVNKDGDLQLIDILETQEGES